MLEVNQIIINKNNPEWGEWIVRARFDEKLWEIDKRGARDGKILSEYEFQNFWEVVK